jgi:Ser/Thr protein kinase RdoA (MazF antagonist)
MVPTLRSIVDPSWLASTVARAYGLEVSGCVLLRSLVNDVYRVDTPAGRFALKLYRAGHDAADREVALAAHVGAGVAQGIPLADGSLAGTIAAAEGPRAFTLWEWAPGAKPRKPRSDDLYRRFGVATAAFHEAAAGFAAPAAVDPVTLLDGVLARLPDPEDRHVTAALTAEAASRIAGAGLERGVCHGDVTLDNVHADGDRLIFYDLDCAAENWLATDLSPVAATPQWPAFLAGYRTVRELPEEAVEALPWLDVLLRLGYLHFHLYAKPAMRGTESLTEGWVDENLGQLRAAAAWLLPEWET